jgi:hypothetical protein
MDIYARIRCLPECLCSIICNDYLGHHLYRINENHLQHAIKIYYDAIDPRIAGKNGSIVYNTDIDGLVYTVLQSPKLFNNIVALIHKVNRYDARIKSIEVGDLIRLYNGASVYAHLVTSFDAYYVYTIPVTIHNYQSNNIFFEKKKRSTMAIEKDYMLGMVSLEIIKVTITAA